MPIIDKISLKGTTYDIGISSANLPTASTSVKGAVKVDGSSITIDANGVISASTPSIATYDSVGSVKPDGETVSIDSDGTLHVLGGGGGVKLGDVQGASVHLGEPGTVELRWTDPNDIVVDGITIAAWAGTLVIKKEGSAPQNERDGVRIIDNKIKNAYSSTEYVDSNVTVGVTYYYRFFPYTTDGAITNGNSYNVKPSLLNIVPFSIGTDTEIATMLNAYYNNEISWQDMGWAIGDARTINLSSMSCGKPYNNKSMEAQNITIVIVAHDHTDLATPINGHTKACITVQTRELLGKATYDHGAIYLEGVNDYVYGFIKQSDIYTRTYLNNIVLEAISSTDLKNTIKPSKHNRHTTYSETPSEEVIDTLFLPSYPEIFGTTSYSNYVATSPAEGTQFEYYKTTVNRVKYSNIGHTATKWWTSSTSSYKSYSSSGLMCYWCYVKADGSIEKSNNDREFCGLAPAWAM